MIVRELGARIVSQAWSGASRIARRFAGPPVRVDGVFVISVGALAAGGAGRTPLAMEIASRLVGSGRRVAIVLRGYRGTASRRGVLVSDGTRVLATAGEAGDEAMLAARRVAGALVRVGADRVAAVRQARAEGARVVVLDDGLQHRRLHRDADVVVVDATPDPRDVLREDEGALERATLLAVCGAPALPVDPRGFAWTLEPEALVDSGLVPIAAPQELEGRSVVVAFGIARPERVVETVRALGARVVGRVFARDHSNVALRAAKARRDAEVIVTTEKDLVREPEAWERLPVVGLRMRVALGAGRERLEALLAT